ncbi:MAG: hypothetical protein BEN18_02030 [Epulopiscium sp. Nuni2H_MBin001]|nr:MAG: hypothetical protein BEN18_02030 [Epulopiscium sp. Nuni2H_MBin001]
MAVANALYNTIQRHKIVKDVARVVLPPTLYSKSAQYLGEAYVEYKLALRYENEDDIQNALYFYEQSATKGFAYAQYKLAKHYQETNDTAQSIKWLKKAAKQNVPEAQFDLGLCYYSGDGVDIDIDRAIKLITLAANNNYSTAKTYLLLHKSKTIMVDIINDTI